MTASEGAAITRVVLGGMWRRRGAQGASPDRLVHQAIDLGITSIDTAPLYAFGEAERALGRAIKGRAGRVQLLTKVGLRWDGDHGEVMFRAEIDGQLRAVRKDSRPQSVRRDVEASLSRLGVDSMYLVQVHELDRHTPLEETFGELCRLREEGKLHHIGVSNFPAQALREAARALGAVPLLTTQEEYSLLAREVEREVLPCARALGVGVLCYAPLAQGLLAGARLDSHRGPTPVGARFHPKNLRLVHRVLREVAQPLARRRGVSLASLSLAWLLCQPGVRGVVCGASDPAQLRDHAAAAELRLSDQELATLREAFEALRLDPLAGQGVLARGRALSRRLSRAAVRRVRRRWSA